jgi:branched-chain amino acid aminotransferase
MLDPEGNVATCNATNFFIVTNGELLTSTGEYCLNGITRGLVIELANAADIDVFEKAFTLTDVYEAQEAFVTGTFGGLTPVVAVDGRTIGGGVLGSVTERLSEIYREAVYGGTP